MKQKNQIKPDIQKKTDELRVFEMMKKLAIDRINKGKKRIST